MNKEQQKQILIDMMNESQKDGLYDVYPGLLTYDEGKWIMYTVCYNNIWSKGIPLHPSEHRTWMHQYQMADFPVNGKEVNYQIEYGDGVPYAVTDLKKPNTSTIGSKLDLILEEIDKIKWMLRDLDSKV
jgi:hypothetical protein